MDLIDQCWRFTEDRPLSVRPLPLSGVIPRLGWGCQAGRGVVHTLWICLWRGTWWLPQGRMVHSPDSSINGHPRISVAPVPYEVSKSSG